MTESLTGSTGRVCLRLILSIIFCAVVAIQTAQAATEEDPSHPPGWWLPKHEAKSETISRPKNTPKKVVIVHKIVKKVIVIRPKHHRLRHHHHHHHRKCRTWFLWCWKR